MKQEGLQFDKSDLVWSAICYLSNELDENSAREFEDFIAHDLAGQEALDQALAMMKYFHAVESADGGHASPQLKVAKSGRMTAEPLSHVRSQTLRWVAVVTALAGCLALVVGVIQWNSGARSQPVAAQQSANELLALSWADSLEAENFPGTTVVGNHGATPFEIDANFAELRQGLLENDIFELLLTGEQTSSGFLTAVDSKDTNREETAGEGDASDEAEGDWLSLAVFSFHENEEK